MSKRNFYAVRRGRETGIFTSWSECEKQVKGFRDCEYKGFSTREEAKSYLKSETNNNAKNESPEAEDTVIAYVDGSYYADLKVYGYAAVVMQNGKIIKILSGANNADGVVDLRNVAGEMIAAMQATLFAIKSGYKRIKIYYDYYGIENWATSKWKTNSQYTKMYSETMDGYSRVIDIVFKKVKGHSGDAYNDMADRMAKEAVQNFFKNTTRKCLTNE